MSSDAKPILAVLAAVALLVLGFYALRPGTTETRDLPNVTLGPPATSTAVVNAKSQSGGTHFLGFRFGRTTYRVSVLFYAPPGCFGLVEVGDEWPAPVVECSSDVPISGELTGLGIASTGESILAVDAEVTEDCFAQLVRGASWPPGGSACLLPES
jgi:hypothetical protein